MNYAEGLVVPHPRKNVGDDPPQYLLSMIDPGQFSGDIEAVKTPKEREFLTVAAASFISYHVSTALWFPEKTEDQDDFADFDIEEPVQLSDLPGKQVADCFGFTAVTSECLEAANINHWVGFANGHATLLLPSNEHGVMHLNDPLSPNLNQTLREALLRGRHSIDEEMSVRGHSAVMLDTFRVALGTKGGHSEVLKLHPWLVYGNEPVRLLEQSALSNPFPTFDPRLKVVMRTFRPEMGRRALQFYQDLQGAVRDNEYLRGAEMLLDHVRLFPEFDARSNHPEVKAIVKNLGEQKQIELGERVLEAYFDNFQSLSRDSRFEEAHGDCLRLLAAYGPEASVAERAIARYRAALGKPRAFKETIKGKIAKTEALLPVH